MNSQLDCELKLKSNLEVDLYNKLESIIKNLKCDKDILLKYDAKNDVLRVYAQKISRL